MPHATVSNPKITRDSLMSLEAYAKARKDFRAQVMAHKKPRTVHLGDHLTLLFEDELTIRYQVQEMLRIEKTFEEAGIQDELDAYNPLVPDGQNWKATMLIEYDDAQASLVFDADTRFGPLDETFIVGTRGAIRSTGVDLQHQTVTLTTEAGTATPLLESQGGETLLSSIVRQVPLRRAGQPEEIAAALTFLALDDASYITGQTLCVGGGLTMGS